MAEDTGAQAFAVMSGLEASCADDMVTHLVELQRRRSEYDR